MKLILFALSFLFIISYSRAQSLPNAGFEIWVTDSGATYSNPQGWTSTNSATTGSFGAFGRAGIVKDSISPHSGSFAAQISTVSVGFNPAVPFAGILTNGIFLNNDSNIAGGTPFNYLPDSVYFYYQYSSSVADSGLMVAYFLRNNNGSRDTVGYAYDTLATADSYTKAALPVFKHDSGNAPPDSVLIIFISCTNPSNPKAGQLIIDDISFGAPYTGVADVKSDVALSVFPNPATDHVTLSIPTNGPAISIVNLFTLDGKKVIFTSGEYPSHQLNINTKQLLPADYLLSVTLENGLSAQHMISITR